MPTSDFEPSELAPLGEAQFQWPRWGLFSQSNGHDGNAIDVKSRPSASDFTAIDMPEARQLLTLDKQWRRSSTSDECTAIWHKMLGIFADQVFTIGIANATKQPVVIKDTLSNVPEQAVYSFDPGAYFGTLMPDTFWFDVSHQ